MQDQSAEDLRIVPSVWIVCRERERILALPHVLEAIQSYADVALGYTLVRAASNGFLRLLQRMHAHRLHAKEAHYDSVESELKVAIEEAAANGHVRVVQWLYETYSVFAPNRTEAAEFAAINGHAHVLAWLHANDCVGRLCFSVMDGAAANGHLEVVQWLHQFTTTGCTTRAMDCAARMGRLDMVRWLHAHRSEGCTTQAMDWAASNGHLDVVQWLHANRSEGFSLAMVLAASNGHAHVAQWLFETVQSALPLLRDVSHPRGGFQAMQLHAVV